MNNNDKPLTAVDVIRCVYLARVAARQGDLESARRWQAKADAWLERTQTASSGDACTKTALRTAQ